MPQQSTENQDVLQKLLASQAKEVEKLGKQQVQEAVQQGVPLEQIAGQLQQMAQPQAQQPQIQQGQQQSQANPEQLIQALQQQLQQQPQQPQQQLPVQQGQQPTQEQAQQVLQQAVQVPEVRQILGGLIRQTGASRQQDLQNVLLEQQIRGQVPLQEGELQKIAIKQAQDLDKAGALTANQLLGKFEPVANNFQQIFDSHQRVLGSAEDPSPAGDLALIFNFMKILDPASVVREGEFANAQNSGAVPDRVRTVYNRLISGERLTTKQRADFTGRADKLFKRKEKSFNNDRKQFSNLAKKNRLDPERIFRKVGSEAVEQIQPGQSGTLSSGMKFTVEQ